MTTCRRANNDALRINAEFGQVVNNKKAMTTSDIASNNTLCIGCSLCTCSQNSMTKKPHVTMSQNKNLYHTCFTRNDDGTRVLINWDNGERCITGMADDPFWNRKLYNKLKRSRVAKKAAEEHISRQKSEGFISL